MEEETIKISNGGLYGVTLNADRYQSGGYQTSGEIKPKPMLCEYELSVYCVNINKQPTKLLTRNGEYIKKNMMIEDTFRNSILLKHAAEITSAIESYNKICSAKNSDFSEITYEDIEVFMTFKHVGLRD